MTDPFCKKTKSSLFFFTYEPIMYKFLQLYGTNRNFQSLRRSTRDTILNIVITSTESTYERSVDHESK